MSQRTKRHSLPILSSLAMVGLGWTLACVLFPTEISPEALDRRVQEHYGKVYEKPGPASRDPTWNSIEAQVDLKNHEFLAAEEREIHAEEVLIFRRTPFTGIFAVLAILGLRAWRSRRTTREATDELTADASPDPLRSGAAVFLIGWLGGLPGCSDDVVTGPPPEPQTRVREAPQVVRCAHCRNTGVATISCTTCGGSGVHRSRVPWAPPIRCLRCNGRGELSFPCKHSAVRPMAERRADAPPASNPGR